MKERSLGTTGITVTELGFGSAPLGGARGPVSERAAFETIGAAWTSGFRFFDTAPYYGLGRSEARIGAALRDHPRDAFVLSTKVGRVLRPLPPDTAVSLYRPGCLGFEPVFDYSYDGIMRSVEQSMLRIGLNRFDLLLVHDLDRFLHRDPQIFEAHYARFRDTGYRALEELKRSGVTKAVGAGLNESSSAARLLRDIDLDCLMLAGRYTLLDKSAEDEVLPICERREIPVLAAGPFNSGLLARGSARGGDFHYAPADAAVVERVARIERICAGFGISLQAAALQFPLRHHAVAAVIPGMVSVDELADITRWYNEAVPEEFWTALQNDDES